MSDPRVVIVVEGGLVQEVFSEQPVVVTIIDYDTEGALEDDPELVKFDRADAYPALARVYPFGTTEYKNLNPAVLKAVEDTASDVPADAPYEQYR